MIAACAKVALAFVVAMHASVAPLRVAAPLADTLDGDVAPIVVVDPCIARDADDCDATLDESPRAVDAPSDDGDIGCGTCDDNADGSCTCPDGDPWEATRADDEVSS